MRFKVFSAASADELEAALNAWTASLPPTARVRRTQLASTFRPGTSFDAPRERLYALVNYDDGPTVEQLPVPRR